MDADKFPPRLLLSFGISLCKVLIPVFSCYLIELKVISEDCDGETTGDTPAADTEQEMADEKQKSDSAQEDSGTHNSSKKKKKRKLNEAREPNNLCECFLGSHNTACTSDAQLEY